MGVTEEIIKMAKENNGAVTTAMITAGSLRGNTIKFNKIVLFFYRISATLKLIIRWGYYSHFIIKRTRRFWIYVGRHL